MLVVTTMLTSIANDLPRTAGIKYIDIWMLFCLLIPVMEIILHTIEDHFIRKYKKDFIRGVSLKITPVQSSITGPRNNFKKWFQQFHDGEYEKDKNYSSAK